MNEKQCTNKANLTSEYAISRIIKGSWQLSTGHTPGAVPNEDHILDDMDAFREAGITTMDFGDIYTGVEAMVGRYIASLRMRFGANAHRLVQLHTKYVPDLAILPTHTPDHVRSIVDRSRERLGVNTVDMVQFHWWDYRVRGYVEAMLALQELQEEGKIRLIGVTNFDVERMREFVDAGVSPATIQLQYSLLDRRPENGMAAFCGEQDIKMLCYGTVAGGLLSEKYLGVPEPTPAQYETRSVTKYKLIVDEFGGWDLFQELLRTLKTIGDKHGVFLSTVASAYILQKPHVAGVIVGARNSSHVTENVAIANLQLDTDDHALIQTILDRGIVERRRGSCL